MRIPCEPVLFQYFALVRVLVHRNEDYFIEHGYGRQHYSEADQREMFRELDAVGLLFPHSGDRT